MEWALVTFLKMQLILKAAEQYERLVERGRSGTRSRRQAGRERGIDVDSLLPSRKSDKNVSNYGVKRWRAGNSNQTPECKTKPQETAVPNVHYLGDDTAATKTTHASYANHTAGDDLPKISPGAVSITMVPGLSSTPGTITACRNKSKVCSNGCFSLPAAAMTTTAAAHELNHHNHLVHHIQPKPNSNPKAKSNSRNKVPVDAKDSMTILQLLALNALDLTIPASDVLLKNRQNSWVQLSGHPGSFAPAGPGTVWKKQNADNNEGLVYEALMKETAAEIVPKYHRAVSYDNENFIEIQDLLYDFTDPKVMDIKMGTRTFLESEVMNTTARADLYEKMVKVDPNAPTPAEHTMRAVTKLRYMTFREQQSSTCELGFRIEAIKLQGSPPMTDLKMIRTKQDVANTLALFLGKSGETVKAALLARLAVIRDKFAQSPYFRTHEVVGSSILIIYDANKVGAWIIDFAKTLDLPSGIEITHTRPWVQDNHEEGYLTGLDNLIKIIAEIECHSDCDSAQAQSSLIK